MSDLKYKYHDSNLSGFVIGPRKEVTLRVYLDPIWNSDVPRNIAIRFGGINNFEEVNEYFKAVPSNTELDFICEIEDISPSEKGKILVVLEGFGELLIKSTNITESIIEQNGL